MRSDTSLNLSAGVASVMVAFSLVLLKLWAFSETASLSVAASLTDSVMDLLVSVAGLSAIFYAARPPDEDHAFGHTSVEDLAALGQALIIAGSAGVIGWAALHRLSGASPSRLSAEVTGIWVMAVSVVLTLGLVLWQRRVAARTRNRVVAADSLHYIGDLLPNLGAILALWVSARFGVDRIDSLVALGAAAVMIYGAARIGSGAWNALMDRGADPKTVAAIAQIARSWPGVCGFHDLKTRTAGSRIFVHLHIELNGDLSLRDAHAIGAALKRAIIFAYPNADVIIHKDVAAPATVLPERQE
ncbi:cation diffusion facilitator family transporter [Phaeovulum sp.]|uniref:cation diffusion facilitator family transporter n=1 Tax=Phaeovulum sp. TaxID=2934796 RepID=UPI0039E22E55